MAPYPKITTFPPLGQLTLIPPEQDLIRFTIIIEWNTYRPAYPFEISLAYARPDAFKHESQWPIIQLRRSANANPHLLDAEDCQRAVYTGKLSKQDLIGQATDPEASRLCLFTVKFRVDHQAPWQWTSISDGTKPGELVFQQSLDTFNQNDLLLTNNVKITEDWKVSPLKNSGNSASAQQYLLESKFRIKANVPGVPLLPTSLAALPTSVRYFSVVRLEPYWLGPRQGRGPFFQTSEDTIATSFLLNNGLIITFVVLGWVDDVYQVFQNDEEGRIAVALQNDSTKDQPYRVVASIGLNSHSTMASAMTQVRTLIAQSDKITQLHETISAISPRTPSSSTEKWLDSLSFCTWNALGQDLTESKLLSALDTLAQNDIHISTLLIDDNWQTLAPTRYDYADSFNRGWAAMEANTSIAPSGLKNLITSIRTAHPGLKDIGVWHALMGYWGGIAPSSPIATKYPTLDIDALLMGNRPSTITTIAPEALHDFYNDFYTFLSDAGITFVKTDVQHMLSTYSSPDARRALISTYQSAWTAAHLRHFGGKAISCMSQIPQTLFHSLLQNNTPSVVHRNSDDFYPEVPASHPWHVWTNAHNAVFGRHLNVVLDWDMFQTDHEFSGYHAAARAVSGGPVLITDTPGRHGVELIRSMTARGFGGGSTVVRTEPGVVQDVFGLYNEVKALRVVARTGDGVVMGLFNVRETEVRDLVHVSEFGVGAGEVLIRSFRAGEVFGPITVKASQTGKATDDDNEVEDEDEARRLVHARLAVRGWEILSAQPVHYIETSGKRIKYCVLGLLGQMSGAAAITAISTTIDGEKTRLQVSLKALGRLGVWFDTNVHVNVQVQGSKVDERFLKTITLPHKQGTTGDDNSGGSDRQGHDHDMATICEVDVEAFWKQKELWDESCESAAVEFLVG